MIEVIIVIIAILIIILAVIVFSSSEKNVSKGAKTLPPRRKYRDEYWTGLPWMGGKKKKKKYFWDD